MATRTYERQLIFLVKQLAKYIGRWQPQLVGFLTPAELTCVQSLLVALTDCITALAPPPDGD